MPGRIQHDHQTAVCECNMIKRPTKTIKKYFQQWSAGSLFLERLFDAFDVNHDKSIDLEEFVQGLNILLKGTPEEKLEFSFRIYDIDHDGFLTKKELQRIMNSMYSTFYNEDQSQRIKEIVERIFEDIDVNGDNQLTLQEYKLSALKEPLVVDFLQQFMNDNAEIISE
ncbi:EF-hand [Rozella allomycis CSF55]|uniref:EF-hand n=1 Tax=Rozella allomycis (strain CSF55) TaxID=988480 RepID=A0A4P9YG85_ROZAC|nr:EF-hand [Rozella allomycis CSF55]